MEREIKRWKRALGRLGEIGDNVEDRHRLLRVVAEVGRKDLQPEGGD